MLEDNVASDILQRLWRLRSTCVKAALVKIRDGSQVQESTSATGMAKKELNSDVLAVQYHTCGQGDCRRFQAEIVPM